MEKSMYKGCWSLQSWHRPFKKPWLLNFLQKHVQQLDGPKHCRRKTGLQCLGRSSFCWICSLTCASFTFPSRFPAQTLVLPGMFKHDLWGNMLKVCYKVDVTPAGAIMFLVTHYPSDCDGRSGLCWPSWKAAHRSDCCTGCGSFVWLPCYCECPLLPVPGEAPAQLSSINVCSDSPACELSWNTVTFSLQKEVGVVGKAENHTSSCGTDWMQM